MAQRCLYKKLTYEDKFARNFYCDHVKLGQLRYEKRHQKKVMRRLSKQEIMNELDKIDEWKGNTENG